MDKNAGIVDAARKALRGMSAKAVRRAQEHAWKSMSTAEKGKHILSSALGAPAEVLQSGMNRAREFIWKKMSPMQKAKYMIAKVVTKVGP
jgi:hypothetical protein